MTKPVNTPLQNGGQGVAQIHRADSWDRKFEEATKERGQSLHLILDFDRTITAFKGKNGEPCDECHDILFRHTIPSNEEFQREVDSFWKRTREDFGALGEKPEEEQVRLLDWWWRAANDLILKYEVEEGHVAEAVRRANTLPRAGALEALRRCVDQGIPVLIISAGFSHVIREFVRLHDPDLAASPLLEIHANHMLVHSKNKRHSYSHLRDYFDGLAAQGRDRPLIVGDSLGDAEVAMHVPRGARGLKIAYANRADADVQRYLAAFDAVLTGDQSFAFVNEVLDALVGVGAGGGSD